MSYLAKNYNRKKISFKYGKGSFLYSTNGKKYLDFVQGIAVNSLGHAHPKLVKTVNKQSKKLWMMLEIAIMTIYTKLFYLVLQPLLLIVLIILKSVVNILIFY